MEPDLSSTALLLPVGSSVGAGAQWLSSRAAVVRTIDQCDRRDRGWLAATTILSWDYLRYAATAMRRFPGHWTIQYTIGQSKHDSDHALS